MKRSLVLVCLVMMMVMALAGTAVAQRPPHAGPPEVEVFPLVEDDEPIVCNGRVLQFSGGEVVLRERTLPGDKMLLTATVRNGRAVDVDDGTEFRVQGSAQFLVTLDEQWGRGHFSITFVGPRGDVHRVHALLFLRDGEEVVIDRGNCEF